jgi:hypothetical protein
MKFLGWFKKAWAFVTGDRAKAALHRIDGMIEVALPIVREVAALTPTRSDDEIVALFEKYRISVKGWLGLDDASKGAALLQAASSKLQEYYPNVPWSQVQAAAQLAYVVAKNN